LRKPSKIFKFLDGLPVEVWRGIRFIAILPGHLVLGVTEETLDLLRGLDLGVVERVEREASREGKLKVRIRLRRIDLKVTLFVGEIDPRRVEEARKWLK